MGEVFKHAARAHRALDQIRRELTQHRVRQRLEKRVAPETRQRGFGFGVEFRRMVFQVVLPGSRGGRGPCGLEELTTYKYVVHGNGQVRE